MKKFCVFSCAVTALLLLASCGNSGSFKIYGAPTSSSVSSKASISGLAFHASPTYEQLNMYAAWVSKSAGCTDLVQIADYGTDGQKFNLFDTPAPTLFQGSPSDGTYNCLVIKMSDTMAFKPDQTDPSNTCVAESTYSYDIARSDTNGWVDQNFAPITTDDNANMVYIFASTDHAQVIANGASTHQTLELTAPLTAPGDITLVVDFTDLVYIQNIDGDDYCWLEKPTMSFK